MGDWDARYWPANVRLARIPTGHTPRKHALIVFAPGTLGAGSTGHIAYVQKVYRDGSFLISEMTPRCSGEFHTGALRPLMHGCAA